MIKSIISKAVAVAAMSLGAASAANAFVISAGNVKISVDNYDMGNIGYGFTPGAVCTNDPDACDAVSQGANGLGIFDTGGIFSVSTISSISTGEVFFTKGVNGYLTGVFGGLRDQTVVNTFEPFLNSLTTTALSVGGFVNLYLNDADWDPTLITTNPGVDLVAGVYPGITGGALYLSADFAAGGAYAGSPTTTYTSKFDTSTTSGVGSGYLDVTGGLAFDTFNTNTQIGKNGGKHDLFLTVTYDDEGGSASSIGWTVTSAGQIKGNAIPEPGALALIALGMIGAGAATTRRKG